MAATKEQDRFDRSVGVAKLARRAGIERKRLWRALNGERAMGARGVREAARRMGLSVEGFAPATLPKAPCARTTCPLSQTLGHDRLAAADLDGLEPRLQVHAVREVVELHA